MSLSTQVPNFTIEVYNDIMDHIGQRCGVGAPAFHFFRTPTYFASAEMFANRVKDTFNVQTYKVKYIMLSYSSFVDSKTKGWDNFPNTNVVFNLQMFEEFSEARLSPDESQELPNSHDSLVESLVELRNTFLEQREIEANKVLHSPLQQIGQLVLAGNSDFIAGDVIGDWVNFRIQVEIN